MQHVETLHAHETRVHVGADKPEWMTNVQPGTARVGKHVEDKLFRKLRPLSIDVAEQTRWIRCPKRALGLPEVLPFTFDLVGEGGVVSEFGDVAWRIAHDRLRLEAKPSRGPTKAAQTARLWDHLSRPRTPAPHAGPTNAEQRRRLWDHLSRPRTPVPRMPSNAADCGTTFPVPDAGPTKAEQHRRV